MSIRYKTTGDNLNGHKSIFVRCEDALGYNLIKTLSFTVDQQAPNIIEARLKDINEVSKC